MICLRRISAEDMGYDSARIIGSRAPEMPKRESSAGGGTCENDRMHSKCGTKGLSRQMLPRTFSCLRNGYVAGFISYALTSMQLVIELFESLKVPPALVLIEGAT